MLQALTEDRFRGRVFSAEFALSMLVLSIVSFLAGALNDAGVSIPALAFGTGLALALPCLSWVFAQRYFRVR